MKMKKVPANFSFQKISRKKNIILFSFLCTKGFKGCNFLYGEGHQKFPPFLLLKNYYKKKNYPF
jgi:hypothetical protein